MNHINLDVCYYRGQNSQENRHCERSAAVQKKVKLLDRRTPKGFAMTRNFYYNLQQSLLQGRCLGFGLLKFIKGGRISDNPAAHLKANLVPLRCQGSNRNA